MRTITRTLVASLVLPLVLAVGGCADDGDSGGSGDPTQTTESTGEGDETVEATRVDFTRSGGIAGVETSYAFAAGQPPPEGFGVAEREAVLEAASDPALQELEVPKPPKDACCDLFTYEVTVRWADGSSRTFTTVDGTKAPAELQALLSAAQR